ncbi:MAG: hypothetical protein HKN19_20145 [Halioglobus sp.]|nr:hypothetical protein [Halioglobus sp.]
MNDNVSTADDLSQYADLIAEVQGMIDAGEYDAGIARFQKVARASGNDALMQRLVELRVEGFKVINEIVDPEPMYEANDLLGDPDAVRARLADDGYLFFRDVLPRDRLLEVRDDMTRILAEHGWIEDGERRMDARAISRPRREGQPKFFAVHDRVMKLESLHSMAHEPHLMDVMRQALGKTAFPHPLSITRLVFPDAPELSTPPHQDFPNNQGTPNLTAAWMPLADCRIVDGSLAILEGSNKFGVLPLKFHLGAGNRAAVLPQEIRDCRWVGADFRLGDLVLFPALTVHKAMENFNTERMRLSIDFRYQLEGEALTEGCLKPHFQRLSWDEIYADWKSDQYQYYWRNKDYVEVPWDEKLHALPDEHIDEAYEQELAFNVAFSRRKEGRVNPEAN